jgi:hypothetical protein
MFVFNRSTAAVLLPLALLLVVALWSNADDIGPGKSGVVAASDHEAGRDPATLTAANERRTTDR